ncbi:hypothetical protein BWQ96_08353 [Gracilariopsis chorda]|uniref:Uncharacterized protein n=1 Tax=Gracilariopsis chorda TaxID=448386 RepID=A0A2V3IIK3_9FLOR|nr:hypothetical protein BWQ96_08353 [Gracilariopsis chorda]|eukprot:PXF41901.1 hypothetical protein BWQ96_08353 [Gracilariopsis chorda]
MELNTNLPVPIFNVLKYLFITLAIDGVVRSGLDGFEHFRRRLSLHRGYSVHFESTRIDRYNLLHQISFCRFSSLVLLFITLAAYAVEIGLEFATDSKATRFPIAGTVRRLNYTRGVCSLDTIIYRTNANQFARLAEECIVLEDNKYRLYRPIWITSPEDSAQPLCEPTPGNLLYESGEVYESLHGKGAQAARELDQLIRTMRAHSYKSNGDVNRSFISMQITSKDIVGKFPYRMRDTEYFTSAVFIKLLGKTGVKCIGTVYGRHGEGMMRVMMLACTNGFTENGTLSYAQGTGLVEMDVGDVDGNWSTIIAVESRRFVYQFARGVVGEQFQTNAVAYAAFLAVSRAEDKINVNKYAIAYRNCKQLSVPSRNPESWVESIPFYRSEPRITATVELWAIIVLVCWLVVVTAARILLHAVANHKGMPNRLLGEQQMVCRWVEEKEREKLSGEGNDSIEPCKRGYLSVENGDFKDCITATKRPRNIIRDRRKSFSP